MITGSAVLTTISDALLSSEAGGPPVAARGGRTTLHARLPIAEPTIAWPSSAFAVSYNTGLTKNGNWDTLRSEDGENRHLILRRGHGAAVRTLLPAGELVDGRAGKVSELFTGATCRSRNSSPGPSGQTLVVFRFSLQRQQNNRSTCHEDSHEDLRGHSHSELELHHFDRRLRLVRH